MTDLAFLTQVFPVSRATRDLCERVGKARTKAYTGTASQRRWNMNADVLGCIGEALVAHLIQIPWAQDVSHRGDDGEDFPMTDVKTVPVDYAEDPGVLRRLADSPHWSPYYLLVVVQSDYEKARLAGWCTGAFLAKAPRKDYGYGATCVRDERELVPGVPPHLLKGKG